MPSADSKPYPSVVVKQQPLRGRLLMVALVVLVHALLLWYWVAMPVPAVLAHHEMSVSLMPAPAQSVARAVPQAAAHAAPQKQVAKSHEPRFVQAAPEIAVHAAQSAVAPPVVTASPAVPARPAETATVATAPVVDTEPDYKAGYLSNPRPAYPMVARRMGWQGRVILNVEVLAEGACGAVSVLHSSGHEVLDNAAMNTVKSWRFVPAKRAGHVVTQWFKVPIVFSLEDNEA